MRHRRGYDMKQEELQELFCGKISMELEKFRRCILRKNPQEIYNNAYRIDSIINIYEQLTDMSVDMKAETLMLLLIFPNLLSYIYSVWIKTEDSSYEELGLSIDDTIRTICRDNGKETHVA